MLKNSEIRAAALDALKGNWKKLVIATLVFLVVAGVASVIPVVSYIFIILGLLPMEFCFILVFLKFLRNEEQDEVKGIFAAFTNKDTYLRTLKVVLLNVLYVLLWMLLLVIPGIIKAYSYAMTYYIANDNAELTAEECICKSMEMMEGHKMQLFLLDLSFIGWALLATLTCGIGYLWLIPYMYTARAKFYEELKANA